MRPAALTSILCLLASVLPGPASVHIGEVGLEGYYAVGVQPTRVAVEVTNPALQAQIIELRLKISATPPYDRLFPNVDTFTKTIQVGPNQRRVLDLPVVFSSYQYELLTVEARDGAGQLIGREQKLLNPPPPEHLIAIVCSDDATCKEAQTQITFSGNQANQAAKAKELKFVVVRESPSVWWAYSAAEVVVAGRLEELNPDEQQALESYARQGGRLVLVEESSRDRKFLGSYRNGPGSGSAQTLGKGRLYQVASLKSQVLGELFSGNTPDLWSASKESGIASKLHPDIGTYLLHRLGTRFTFPGLGWLLLWLAAYILCAGPLNFTILNRLRRREWGWMTVPALAVLFSAALYESSAARRPKEFRTDQVSLYWMDDRSPIAAVEEFVRVSAPRRADPWLALPGDTVFAGETRNSSGAFEATGFAIDPLGEGQGYSVRLDSPRQVRLPLLQWSFRDSVFADIRRLDGTVRRVGARELRNDTGLTFTKAIYVDRDNVYTLGAVAAGAEIDLAGLRKDPLSQETGRSFAYPQPLETGDEGNLNQGYLRSNPAEAQKELEEQRLLPNRPFEPVELIRGWPRGGGRSFTARSGLFFGLAEGSAAGAWLMNMMSARRNWIVAVVSLEPVHD